MLKREITLQTFWLNPVELEDSYGFNAPEINELRKLIIENQQLLINAWNEYFS